MDKKRIDEFRGFRDGLLDNPPPKGTSVSADYAYKFVEGTTKRETIKKIVKFKE